MARSAHPLATGLTLTVPLWLVVVLPVLLMTLVVWGWFRGASTRQQLAQLEAQVYKLSLQLEAEKSRSEAYSIEALQLQQSLGVLETEINQLRARIGLPRIRLVPAPSQPDPIPGSVGAPKGAGEPIDLGSLLLSLRSQVSLFADELEATAIALDNPLPPDPPPGRTLRRPLPPAADHTPRPRAIHTHRPTPAGRSQPYLRLWLSH